MKKIILLAIFAASSLMNAQNGKGKMFPEMEAVTFNKKDLKLPADVKGKFTIIGMCFSKDAEGDLQTWLNPLYNAYVVKHEGDAAMGVAEPADVYFYLMPKFSIFNKLTMGASMDQIKKGTDKGFYDNLMFYTGGLKEYKKDLEVEKTDQPFIYVLDKDGKIVHVEKGVCNDKKMSAIDDVVNAD